jgi:hypothetical protein
MASSSGPKRNIFGVLNQVSYRVFPCHFDNECVISMLWYPQFFGVILFFTACSFVACKAKNSRTQRMADRVVAVSKTPKMADGKAAAVSQTPLADSEVTALSPKLGSMNLEVTWEELRVRVEENSPSKTDTIRSGAGGTKLCDAIRTALSEALDSGKGSKLKKDAVPTVVPDFLHMLEPTDGDFTSKAKRAWEKLSPEQKAAVILFPHTTFGGVKEVLFVKEEPQMFFILCGQEKRKSTQTNDITRVIPVFQPLEGADPSEILQSVEKYTEIQWKDLQDSVVQILAENGVVLDGRGKIRHYCASWLVEKYREEPECGPLHKFCEGRGNWIHMMNLALGHTTNSRCWADYLLDYDVAKEPGKYETSMAAVKEPPAAAEVKKEEVVVAALAEVQDSSSCENPAAEVKKEEVVVAALAEVQDSSSCENPAAAFPPAPPPVVIGDSLDPLQPPPDTQFAAPKPQPEPKGDTTASK